MPLFRLSPWALVASLLYPSNAFGQQQRPLAIEDLFALEQIASVAASPDGEWLAVVISRPRSPAEKRQRYASSGDVDHADVWLVPRRGGERRNITRGLSDGSGYWNPVWSPDGQRLAMLSTRDTERTPAPSVHVWEMGTQTLHPVIGRADLGAYGDQGIVTYGMMWSDRATILCPVEPDDAPPMGYRVWNPPDKRTVREWAKAEQGVEATVSVLESGRELPEQERPTGQLIAIDVESKKSRVIAKGNFRQLLLSPTRRHIALLAETGRIPPRADRRIPYGDRFREMWRTRLLVLSLAQGLNARWIDGVIDPKLMLGDSPHSWSPSGAHLAVIGKARKDDETAGTLWLVSAEDGAARRVTDSELEVSATAWSNGGALLARGRVREQPVGAHPSSRLDWWRVSLTASHSARSLTTRLEAVPTTLAPTPDRWLMTGIAAGDLWAVDIRNGGATNLTDGFEREIEDEVWPMGAQRNARYDEPRIVRSRHKDLYRVEWTGPSARLRWVWRPWPNAELAEFRPEQRFTVFTGAPSNGTFLWTGDGHSDRFEQRIRINEFVGGIADPKRMLIGYRGTDGDSLAAMLLLPFGYESGSRYPMITWTYPAWQITDSMSFAFFYDKQSVSSLNLQLLLTHGYALLIPSVPMPPDGQATDVYTELPKGVIPAIDKAIDLGIADPERLGLMGHSFGGYSVYALVTYTNRFKVAVSIAGPADLVSLYGAFWPDQRYHDYPHEELFQAALAESGQLRLGANPWRDPWRYVRNSPTHFADRVETPLMMIQGDQDYVPIQQGEEFFTALYRLGKRAKFVRYWGEGHTIETPVNTRDMWRRILGWLEEHLDDRP